MIDGLNGFVGLLLGLVALAVIAGGLYAVLKNSERDATEKRLREENEDLLRRLNFALPQLKAAEEQNAVLKNLANPTAQLNQMSTESRAWHEETMRVLDQQMNVLRSIDQKLQPGE